MPLHYYINQGKLRLEIFEGCKCQYHVYISLWPLKAPKKTEEIVSFDIFTPFGVSIIFVPTTARCVNTVCLLPFDTNGHKNDVNITLNIN